MEIEKNDPGKIIELAEHEDETKKKLSGYIWDESKIIKKKVFPMDEHNNFFYYGLLLPREVDEELKGKRVGKKQIHSPTLITSIEAKRNLVELNLRSQADLKIDFESVPTYLPHRWDLDKIKSYLQGRDNPIDKIALLNLIKDQYEKYTFIRNHSWYKVHALWDLGTYLYQVFEAYPFIELRGLAATGKTKAMTISSFISFNGGSVMVNPSEATLFRETDEVRGSKYFDEAEKLWIWNPKSKQMEGDLRTELINASFEKIAKVPRQEKIGNKFVTKWYDPYSPIQLSSINGLYGANESRAITRITTKSPDGDERGEREPSEDRNDPIWAEIRDQCYRFALYYWKEIKEIYNNFPECGLKRRDLRIWKPLLSIAKFISEEVYTEILEFAKEFSSRKLDDLIQESTFDFACLEALRDAIIKNFQTEKIYVEWIKKEYCERKGDQEGITDKYLNRNISNHLDRLGFKELRKRDNKSSYFSVTKEVYDQIVAPLCPKLAFQSTPSPPSTHLYINDNKKNVDDMLIDVDKKKEKVAIVAISGENVDTWQDGDGAQQSLCSTCRKEQASIIDGDRMLCLACFEGVRK